MKFLRRLWPLFDLYDELLDVNELRGAVVIDAAALTAFAGASIGDASRQLLRIYLSAPPDLPFVVLVSGGSPRPAALVA
jgi:hypothetical protein